MNPIMQDSEYGEVYACPYGCATQSITPDYIYDHMAEYHQEDEK